MFPGSSTRLRGWHPGRCSLLGNGNVLAVGGVGGNPPGTPFPRDELASAELYDPSTESWSPTASMNVARYVHTATLLNSGEVLVAGGFDGAMALGSAELFRSAPCVLIVAIDIKPGSDPNSINLSSAGVIPVAILSSSTFDATQVDPATVALAAAKVKLIGKGDRYACSPEDVNADGLVDLVCHLMTAQFMIEPDSSVAVLEATTFGGQAIRGEDAIQIVPD